MSETIVSAAIYHGMIYSLPRPARHGQILFAMPDSEEEGHHPRNQGFLTSEGRYVSREEARHIAWISGQIKDGGLRGKDGMHPTQLFSEDLW